MLGNRSIWRGLKLQALTPNYWQLLPAREPHAWTAFPSRDDVWGCGIWSGRDAQWGWCGTSPPWQGCDSRARQWWGNGRLTCCSGMPDCKITFRVALTKLW